MGATRARLRGAPDRMFGPRSLITQSRRRGRRRRGSPPTAPPSAAPSPAGLHRWGRVRERGCEEGGPAPRCSAGGGSPACGCLEAAAAGLGAARAAAARPLAPARGRAAAHQARLGRAQPRACTRAAHLGEPRLLVGAPEPAGAVVAGRGRRRQRPAAQRRALAAVPRSGAAGSVAAPRASAAPWACPGGGSPRAGPVSVSRHKGGREKRGAAHSASVLVTVVRSGGGSGARRTCGREAGWRTALRCVLFNSAG